MVGLNSIQKRTLELFAASPLAKRFYWTGGTLLSVVYLRHRTSEDLDFFSDKPFTLKDVEGFIETLKQSLGLPKVQSDKIHDRLEFLIHNKEKVRIEFVLYEHSSLKPRGMWRGILIDSFQDIAVNKTMALFDRVQVKDLFDLYFLLTEKKVKVSFLLAGVEKKFGIKLVEDSFWSSCLKSLDDLDNMMPFLLLKDKKSQENLLTEIKDYFTKNSAAFLHRVLE